MKFILLRNEKVISAFPSSFHNHKLERDIFQIPKVFHNLLSLWKKTRNAELWSKLSGLLQLDL